jgi:hypothetical protein
MSPATEELPLKTYGETVRAVQEIPPVVAAA